MVKVPHRKGATGRLINRAARSGDTERFWAKVQKTETCWLWTASVNRSGYGQFWLPPSRLVRAHRYAYELVVGPIPSGLTLDHLCRNVRCVRPDHLEPVTAVENVMRGDGVTARNLAKVQCPRGHALNEANTYRSPKGRACRICRTAASRRSKERKRKSS